MSLVFWAVFTSLVLGLVPLSGHTALAQDAETLIVRNDRGGELAKRLRQIRELRQSGRPVEIRGGVCFSTCTMFLGLPQTCISSRTVFGFHGPSSYGRPLAPKVFEEASHVIADHYPPALKRWYLETGRYRIRTLHRIRGARLIDLGVRGC
ncbi:hypothetical protein [Roseovarius phycicola]|uniref:Uncharacterized protein n=1 Tax=Roseovarius phycicola TaxID=3080976 RepID=A0ABZ2HG07_9RHOB